MKLVLKILFIFMLLSLSSACSHGKSIQPVIIQSNHKSFTLDNRDYIGKKSLIGVRLHLSKNTMINFNLRSIAEYIQPSDIEKENRFYLQEVETQPWALFEISF